jgi:lipopolysaccharide/colanic/teichoic acid biosynthesis glycosyltransferase
MYKFIIKSLFDFFLSILALIMLSPLLLGIIAVLLVVNKGRPFFFQNRPGKNGKIFRVIKFRTMVEKKDGEGRLLPDKIRITRFGNFMRSTSLDELPQLINILTGKMSFVGPRPLLKEYLSLYSHTQSRRHEVRPGLTGWAQVNGRNTLTWKDKLEMDVWYVDHITFWLDLKIIGRTLIKIVKRENINYPGLATMIPFTGNN